MKRALLVCVFVFLLPWLLSAQVTGNVISRVFQIRVGRETGSSFIVDSGDKQYLVTAEHMVSSLGDKGTVDLFYEAKWHPMEFAIVHSKRTCVDIAVLVPKQKHILNAEALPFADHYVISQEVYFLGFPYGLFTDAENLHMAAPLIKHGYLSATVSCPSLVPGSSPSDSLILVDGFNNPGFSGGPVVAPNLNDPKRALRVIGVISGYRQEGLPVYINGMPSLAAKVQTNTGIVVVVPIAKVTDLIREAQTTLDRDGLDKR